MRVFNLGQQLNLAGPTGTVGLDKSTYRTTGSGFQAGLASALTLDTQLAINTSGSTVSLSVKLQAASVSGAFCDLQLVRSDNANTSNEQTITAADVAALGSVILQTTDNLSLYNDFRVVAKGDGTNATSAGDSVKVNVTAALT